MVDAVPGISIEGAQVPGIDQVLTPHALTFLAEPQREFGTRRNELLRARDHRQQRLDAGEPFDFLPDTAGIRERDWSVASAPSDLHDRRVEITGPAEPKMTINALN